jgi:hypothetical protein
VRFTWSSNTCGAPVQFASWLTPAPWITASTPTTTVGTAIDAKTAMIWSDKTPRTNKLVATDPKTRDWQAVWSYTAGSSSTVVLIYFHGNDGLVTVANPSQPVQYIFSGPSPLPTTGTLAPAKKGLYPVQPADGVLPSWWASSSCTWNRPVHLKTYGSLLYPAPASAPKYRIDDVARTRGFVALVPEVGIKPGDDPLAKSFQLTPFINDLLTKLGGSGIIDPVKGTAQTYSAPASSGIKKVLVSGHSGGGGVLKQLRKDPLFTSAGALSGGQSLSVTIANFDGMYGGWGKGYGALYKANTKLRLWLVNLTSAHAGAMEADFATEGIGERNLDSTGTSLSGSKVNAATSASGLYLYTIAHTLGKTDAGVQAALANPSYTALLIQTNTPHDEIPFWFLPWMADAL